MGDNMKFENGRSVLLKGGRILDTASGKTEAGDILVIRCIQNGIAYNAEELPCTGVIIEGGSNDGVIQNHTNEAF